MKGAYNMIGSLIPTFLNMQYRCCKCGKELGDKYSKLKGKKQTNVHIINGKYYCDRCFDEQLSK